MIRSMEKIMEISPNLSTDGIIRTCFSQDLSCKNFIKISTSVPDDDSHPVMSMYDNDKSTFFISSAKDNFINIEFKGGVLLKGVMLYGIYAPYPDAYDILGSNDNLHWDLIESKPNLNGELDHSKKLYNISQQKIYKTIKLHFPKRGGLYEMDYYGELYHFEVFECTYLCRMRSYNFILFVYLY